MFWTYIFKVCFTYEWCNAVLIVSFSEVSDSYPELATGIYFICGILVVVLVFIIIRFICLYPCCKCCTECPYRGKSIFRYFNYQQNINLRYKYERMFDLNYKGINLNILQKRWFWQQTKVIMLWTPYIKSNNLCGKCMQSWTTNLNMIFIHVYFGNMFLC